MEPSAGRVVLVYGVFAALWILLSDSLLGLLVTDHQAYVDLSIAKGWLFVAATSALLYCLVSRLVARLHVESAAREETRERDLRESRRRLAVFIERAPAALAMFDSQMCYVAASARWKQDYQIDEGDILGACHYELCPQKAPLWRESFPKAMNGERVFREEERFVRPDGSVQWLRWEICPWYAKAELVGGAVVFSEDITERKHAEAELRVAAVAFASQQAVFITDRKGIILRVNQAFEDITGYGASDVVGKNPRVLQSGRHDKAFYDDLWASLLHNGRWRGEIWNRRKNGEVYPEELTISAVLDHGGAVSNYVASFADISDYKHAEDAIYSLSFYDTLTGLPNRRLTLERLKQDLSSEHRAAHYGAVLIVDLDRFSLVNDGRTRQAGDAALVEVARRMVNCVSTNDTVGRLGSDEFVVLVGELDMERDRAALRANEIAERVLSSIRGVMILDGMEHVSTACIGIRLYQSDTGTLDDLFKQAHVALNQAKQSGPGSIHFFDIDMQDALEKRVMLESLLRSAIPVQFALHYQPQVDRAGHVSGAEALIRWSHPNRGAIPPADFIPLAEETGMIVPIGAWVLETACRQLKSWESDVRTQALSLAVNVSAKQLTRPSFVEEVMGIIERTGANPNRLELELTESALFKDAEAVTEKMIALKARGIRFSLDDFGTGFSSLTYLRRMPLDKLKIDQSFVSDVQHNANDAAIARTIIALGESMGLSVVAEGVETEEQWSFLSVHGCGSYQGFLFGKPDEADALEQKIRSGTVTLH